MKRLMSKLVVYLAIVSMFGCAIQNVKTDSNVYVGHTYDEVWSACVRAVNDVEFRIENSEKDGGILMATKEANFATQNEAPQMIITLDKTNTGIYVDVQYVEPGQLVNMFSTGTKTIKAYLSAVNARLKGEK